VNSSDLRCRLIEMGYSDTWEGAIFCRVDGVSLPIVTMHRGDHRVSVYLHPIRPDLHTEERCTKAMAWADEVNESSYEEARVNFEVFQFCT